MQTAAARADRAAQAVAQPHRLHRHLRDHLRPRLAQLRDDRGRLGILLDGGGVPGPEQGVPAQLPRPEGQRAQPEHLAQPARRIVGDRATRPVAERDAGRPVGRVEGVEVGTGRAALERLRAGIERVGHGGVRGGPLIVEPRGHALRRRYRERQHPLQVVDQLADRGRRPGRAGGAVRGARERRLGVGHGRHRRLPRANRADISRRDRRPRPQEGGEGAARRRLGRAHPPLRAVRPEEGQREDRAHAGEHPSEQALGDLRGARGDHHGQHEQQDRGRSAGRDVAAEDAPEEDHERDHGHRRGGQHHVARAEGAEGNQHEPRRGQTEVGAQARARLPREVREDEERDRPEDPGHRRLAAVEPQVADREDDGHDQGRADRAADGEVLPIPYAKPHPAHHDPPADLRARAVAVDAPGAVNPRGSRWS